MGLQFTAFPFAGVTLTGLVHRFGTSSLVDVHDNCTPAYSGS